jgi:hypothetical protein
VTFTAVNCFAPRRVRLSPFVFRARNEDSHGESFLFSKERQDCSIQVGRNLELLPMKQHFVPNRMLPAIVLILNAGVELTGEPLAQNWCGRHEEGKIALRVHKISELVLNHHEKWVQAVYVGIPNVFCDPRFSLG